MRLLKKAQVNAEKSFGLYLTWWVTAISAVVAVIILIEVFV